MKKNAFAKHNYNSLVTLASAAAIGAAFLLIAIKFYAWLETGSSGVLVSLIDSSIDALSSIINFIVLSYALAPADEEHRFGHGKAESIASLGQAAFIFGSAGFLILHATEKLFNPHTIEKANLGINIIAISIVITLLLVTFQKYIIKRTQSPAIQGDSLHYSSDLFMNLAVIGGLFVSQQGYPQADPVIALLVGFYIIYSAFQLAKKSIHSLLDRELDIETQQEIGNIALAQPKVLGLHDLRTRDSGKTIFIQMHLEMDDLITLLEAHKVADAIEDEILKRFPNADIIVHQDPISAVDKNIIVPFEKVPLNTTKIEK
jgi:ferrous-iron efflux pump FieF